MFKRFFLASSLAAIALLLCAQAAFAIVYVKWDATGTPDGNSWNTAYRTIQPAVDDAEVGGEEVWVARGTYTENITLKNGVIVKGGYAGVGTTRNIATYVTIIQGNGSSSTVIGAHSSGIDGFTIRGGYYGVYASGVYALAVSNNIVRQSVSYGVYLYQCESPTVNSNTFTSNGNWAAFLQYCSKRLSFSGNGGSGNWGNGLYLDGCSITVNSQWQATNNFPYVVSNTLSVAAGKSLTIDPGTVVKFDNPSSLFSVNGSIIAQGTVPAPIYFTSIYDDSVGGDTNADGNSTIPGRGDWAYVAVGGDGSSGTFDRCVFRYGGSHYWYYAELRFDGGGSIVTNCTFTESAGSGVIQNGVNNPIITGCTISDCEGYGAYILSCQSPTINGNTFSRNYSWAVNLGGCSGTLSFSGNSGSLNGGNGLLMSSCTVSQNSQWQPMSNFPYVISGDMILNADITLTVDPGCVVKSLPNSGLVAYGHLVAAGTAGSRIHFTSLKDDSVGGDTNADGNATIPARGDWYYLWTSGTMSSTALQYCDVNYGGTLSYGAVESVDDGNLSIADCTITHSSGAGVYHSSYGTFAVTGTTITDCANEGLTVSFAASAQVTGCTISNCGGHGANIYGCEEPILNNNAFNNNSSWAAYIGSCSGSLSFSGNTGSGNIGNAILLNSCTINDESHWPINTGLVYAIGGNLSQEAGHTLEIDPGCVVKFLPNASLYVSGNLQSVGTSGAPINFTSIKDDTVGGDTNADGSNTTPARGDWRNIWVGDAGARGTLDHCVIAYGGVSGSTANLICTGDAMTVTNSTISHSGSHGAYYSGVQNPQMTGCTVSDCATNGMHFNSCASPIATGNTFTNNGSWAMYLSGCWGDLSSSSNGGSSNKGNGIYLSGCTVDAESRWQTQTNFPYVIYGGLAVSSNRTLTIDPSAVVKFDGNSSTVQVTGTLNASGTDASPIYFTSLKDDTVGGDTCADGSSTTPARGDWGAIASLNPTSSLTLDHCMLSYGGTGTGCVNWSGTPTSITNCDITQSMTYGLFISSVANAHITDNAISRCRLYGAYLNNCSSPELLRNTFENNGSWPAYLSQCGGELSFSGNTGSGNRYNGLYFAYSGDISLDSEWEAQANFPYVINGTMYVEPGTTLTIQPGANVKFDGNNTDFSVNGTISAIGTAASPIYFTSIKDDCVVGDTNGDADRTTSAPGDWAGIGVTGNGAQGAFDHCVIRYAGHQFSWPYSGIYSDAGAVMGITNCTVVNNDVYGICCVWSDPTPPPTIANCIIAYNPVCGMYLSGEGATVNYCDFWQNGQDYCASVPTEVECFRKDPMFVDAICDLRLRPESPCIDSGDPGILDPDGSISDRGAVSPWPCVSFTKTRADNVAVMVVHATVTAGTDKFTSFAYIEDWDRTAGIEIIPPQGVSIPTGQSIELKGTISTINGERVITASQVWLLGSRPVPAPIGVNNKTLGGGDWRYDANTGAGQKGMSETFGLNNIGLLIRTWGHVTQRSSTPSPGWFILDDGSEVSVKVILNTDMTLPALNSRLGVTGLASCELTGEELFRLVRPRENLDIRSF